VGPVENVIKGEKEKGRGRRGVVIAIPDHFRNPGISGLKTRNPGIPGLIPG
jgi:hypothetical protein